MRSGRNVRPATGVTYRTTGRTTVVAAQTHSIETDPPCRQEATSPI